MSERIFQRAGTGYTTDADVMTVQGAAIKTGILILLAFAAAAFSWQTCMTQPQLYPAFAFGGGIAGFVLVLVSSFKPKLSPYTAPMYAVVEGLALGAISVLMNQYYPEIAIQAVCLTFGTLFTMCMVYSNGWIKVTDRLRTGLMAALGGIFFIYLASFILGFFGVQIPYIHGNGPIGIGFSLIVVGVAAFFLLLDFDFITKGAQYGAPKYMEWYGALGLMVTLVWLYLEILRLLSKLQSRD
jgi:uncharacterized YccA/Bax inhibitor family protein